MKLFASRHLFSRVATLGVVAAVCGLVFTAWGCAPSSAPVDIPFTPTPVPQDVIGPGLTRSAADVVRQSQHIATIIAARPTEVPIAPSGLAVPAASVPVLASGSDARSGGLVAPTPVGVWWWRDHSGDFTPAGVLRAHPDGAHLDMLDGVLDYHEPLGHYGLIGDYYRERVGRLLLDEAMQLMMEADLLTSYDALPSDDDLVLQVSSHLGWEVVDAEAPRVRYWSLLRIQKATYRLGGVVAFALGPWPLGVEYHSPFAERLQPAEMLGSVVLERVE